MSTLDTLYVWVSTYPDGTVGIIGAGIPGIGATPLVTRDARIALTMFRAFAENHKKATGQKCWLRRYTSYEDEAEI